MQSQQSQELAVIDTNSLSLDQALTVSEQLTTGFYQNETIDAQIDRVIELSTNIVYPIDDDGEKSAKEFAAKIRKFAKTVDDNVTIVVKKETEAVTQWKAGKKSQTDQLRDNARYPLDQFEERKAEKLNTIRGMLNDCLDELWNAAGVKVGFRLGNISPMVKLNGALTPGGKLTAQAVKFCQSIADANFAWQQKIEMRHLTLKNRCLENEINPPLTSDHLGDDFFADDDIFNARLDKAITAEIDRIATMKERIRKQNEAENQRRIDQALKAQQDEADKKAREEAAALAPEPAASKPEPVRQGNTHVQQKQSAPAQVAPPSKRIARFTATFDPAALGVNFPDAISKAMIGGLSATFEIAVHERVSDINIENHFKSSLPPETFKALKSVEF
jgi:hypothetical protein